MNYPARASKSAMLTESSCFFDRASGNKIIQNTVRGDTGGNQASTDFTILFFSSLSFLAAPGHRSYLRNKDVSKRSKLLAKICPKN